MLTQRTADGRQQVCNSLALCWHTVLPSKRLNPVADLLIHTRCEVQSSKKVGVHAVPKQDALQTLTAQTQKCAKQL